MLFRSGGTNERLALSVGTGPGRHKNLKVYIPNNRASKYMKQNQTELKEEIEDLYNTIKQQDLIDVYRTLHQTITEYICFQVPTGNIPR